MKRRKPIKRQSDRGKLEKKMDDIFREILKIERAPVCEICGRSENNLPYPLGVFHILPKGKYPAMRYHRQNVLLSCWTSTMMNTTFCHDAWHHCCKNEAPYKRVEEGIVKKLGPDYWEHLLLVDRMQPKHGITYLRMRYVVFKVELKQLKEADDR